MFNILLLCLTVYLKALLFCQIDPYLHPLTVQIPHSPRASVCPFPEWPFSWRQLSPHPRGGAGTLSPVKKTFKATEASDEAATVTGCCRAPLTGTPACGTASLPLPPRPFPLSPAVSSRFAFSTRCAVPLSTNTVGALNSTIPSTYFIVIRPCSCRSMCQGFARFNIGVMYRA